MNAFIPQSMGEKKDCVADHFLRKLLVENKGWDEKKPISWFDKLQKRQSI